MSTPQIRAARRIANVLDALQGDTIPVMREVLDEALAALDPDLPPFDDVDITNQFLLGVTGTQDRQLFNFTLRPSPMTRDQALVTAAWLVTLADPLHERFPTIERMVHNT